MGRYKSVLMAESDAKAFPHHVDVPVPGNGLGQQMDRMADWLRRAVGDEWRAHGARAGGAHLARYMFRTQKDADAFRRALDEGF